MMNPNSEIPRSTTAATADDFRKRLRELIADYPSKEEKLRKLRDYARKNVPGAWHYPDDREPCSYCPQTATGHRPNLGIRGYVGTGPYALVSHVPSGDVHFKSDQAQTYWPLLGKFGLSNALQTDAFNSAKWMNREEQQALFQIQIEVVEPTTMFVMDMHSYPRRRSDGWAGIGFLPTIEDYLGSGPFSFEVQRQYRPQAPVMRAGTVNYLDPEAKSFSFGVFTIYHYTKLADDRFGRTKEERVAKWEERLLAVLAATGSPPVLA